MSAAARFAPLLLVAACFAATRQSAGPARGTPPFPEVATTFYRDTLPVAYLALASGAFEARVDGRVLHRPASVEEALAFAHAAGVPVMHGPSWSVGARKEAP